MQHHFQYYNIQCLDVVQMPREPVDYVAYETALSANPLRHWELTNTRYLLAPTAMLDPLNQQIDPGQKRFRIATEFEIIPKPWVVNPTAYEHMTAVQSTNGPCALFEFTGALPRAKLYTNWRVNTNDQATLAELASPSFAPADTVLVADALPASSALGSTNQPAGSVQFVSYAPKQLHLRAKATAASVLLLNDHFDPNWKVSVDGKLEPLLRCNYIMQGVQVPSGTHEIEFRFEPPQTSLYVSLAAIGLGLVLIGVLGLSRAPEEQPSPQPAAPSAASAPRAKRERERV
jgi:hypothetical protein